MREKLKNRKFKRTLMQVSIVGTLGINAIVSATYAYNNPSDTKVIRILEDEAKIHGGYAEMVEDDMRLENHPCHIGTPEEGSVEERLIKYAQEHGLSDEIADAVVAKFNLYYENKYEQAEKINLNKIYLEIKKQEKDEEKDYSNNM